jgi:aminoglycoside phosphotransferase (APT) family kinase protein
MKPMDSLPGGYTNQTRRSADGHIEKRYRGDDRRGRAAREHACLRRLAELLPVPAVIAYDHERASLTMVEVVGRHGQLVLDTDDPARVLRLTGALLRTLQHVTPDAIPELPGSGTVIVHGDFGVQNLLIENGRITALVDWELVHRGEPIEDLAWAEWIVRMHHRHAVDALGELHHGAGLHFDWSTRQAAMVRHCEDVLQWCERQRNGGADQWRERLRTTEAWTD